MSRRTEQRKAAVFALYQADVTKMVPFAVATILVMVMLGTVSIWLDIFRPLANPFQ